MGLYFLRIILNTIRNNRYSLLPVLGCAFELYNSKQLILRNDTIMFKKWFIMVVLGMIHE